LCVVGNAPIPNMAAIPLPPPPDLAAMRCLLLASHGTMQLMKPGFHPNAIACVGKQPIMVATASTEHPIGCKQQPIGCSVEAVATVHDWRLRLSRFSSKRNARNANDCVWMETGLESLSTKTINVPSRRTRTAPPPRALHVPTCYDTLVCPPCRRQTSQHLHCSVCAVLYNSIE